MIRHIATFAASMAFLVFLQAQEIKYDIASIPAKLKENAHVIKRYENIRFDVKDVDRAVYSVHRVLTVLDEKAESELFFQEYTNKLRKIEEFEIKVYDEFGRVTNKFRKKDLERQAMLDGLVTDGMIHYMRLGSSKYPVTVEYKYEVEMTGTAVYPSYIIQDSDESVEYSVFTASVPAELDLRFREQKVVLPPAVSSVANILSYKWEVKNLLPYKDEENTVNGRYYYPSILLAPNKFRHYNTFGEMTSWKAFGKWAYDLMKGLDELPEERKAFFNTLVKDAGSDREKVALLYQYLQKNFRYVSIQLGIGGVKPFPVKFTDEKKYGDCKGLSFFLHSALKSVGINSYCALINAQFNSEPVSPEFPSDRFNHEILCVPLGKDTVWLECTSNEAEFGVLGTFTENRYALLLTEDGGVLVPTPKSNPKNNTYITKTDIQLDENGFGAVKTSTYSNGEFRQLINSIVSMKKDDQKESIVRGLGFRNPDEFLITKKSDSPLLNVDIEMNIENVPQFKAGTKMFLNQRFSDIWVTKLPKSEARRNDYYFKHPFLRIDTTTFHFPEGYVPEVIPKVTKLQCDYASYQTEYVYDNAKNQLLSIAKLELLQHRIPAADYAKVKEFFDKVGSDETQKLIIKKN